MRVAKVTAVGAAVVGVLAGLIGGDAVSTDARNSASPSPSVTAEPLPLPQPAVPNLLSALDSATVSTPDAAGIAAAIGPHLDDLGERVGVVVATDGQTRYERNGGSAFIPASTTKLLTAAAALSTLDHDTRFTTAVVRGDAGSEVVLVGGGDPLLTSRTADPHPAAATLAGLADETAQALAGRHSVTLRYDASLFNGPPSAPGWRSSYVAPGSASVGRISALAVDGGRVGKRASRVRTMDPAGDAAKQFAALLLERGIDVRIGGPTGPAATDLPRTGNLLAAVSSPPLAAIVETMLTTSDNDIAEVLARHVALARGEPASFAGAAAAVADSAVQLGVDTEGVRLFDGSGLSRSNAIPPHALAELLALAGSAQHPELRVLLTGLPVAGFSGTLDDRAAGDSGGFARAKTGTLRGVNALAGFVQDADGRLLVFVVLADRVSSPSRAIKALDAIAAALTACGCRSVG